MQNDFYVMNRSGNFCAPHSTKILEFVQEFNKLLLNTIPGAFVGLKN